MKFYFACVGHGCPKYEKIRKTLPMPKATALGDAVFMSEIWCTADGSPHKAHVVHPSRFEVEFRLERRRIALGLADE